MSAALPALEDIRHVVDRAIGGDEAARMAIVQRYRERVFRLCYRMLGQHEDAEDMVQEAFVRVLRHLHCWDRSRDFEPWLFKIAANRCRTLLARRVGRHELQPLLDSPLDRSWTEQSAAEHLAEEVELALKSLRVEHRRAFLLFHKQELNYAEISTSLGVPVGTVKTWVHRARREIIEQLQSRGVVGDSKHAV